MSLKQTYLLLHIPYFPLSVSRVRYLLNGNLNFCLSYVGMLS